MSHASSQQQQSSRPQDPNVLQRIASNPESSVWVGASAGSGKTKVLTDRILRLLLPSSKAMPGTAPHKILALTFTKAGASEMALRINKRLSEWAINEEKDLKENLKKLLGQEATPEQIDAARKLFADVIDTPGGLKIMTIHSFCQSVLSRFPLESGLPPHFTALEEDQSQILLLQARDQVLKEAQQDKGAPLSEAISNVMAHQNEEQFTQVLQNLLSERRQLREILSKNFGVNGLYTALCQQLNIPLGKTSDDILFDACHDNEFDKQGLYQACKILATGTEKTDHPRGLKIQNWLENNQKNRMTLFADYKSAFIGSTTGTMFKDLPTKKLQEKNPDILPVFEAESMRLITLENTLKSANIAALTRDLFLIGEEVLERYDALKSNKAKLDFDDLILRTLDLLQGRTEQMTALEAAPWIRFKLDQGIDHILVDEAQDTNPEQWEIIQALCDDFFDGSTDRKNERTVFVVGDEKQSIFSFQRASPDKFHEMHTWFDQKIKQAQGNFDSVDFNTSFRSVSSVLQLVDNIFDDPAIRKGLAPEPLKHKANRYTQPGLVELWPLFKTPQKKDYDPWAPPIKITDSTSGAAQMATHIGETIAGWIKNKEILESHDRPIQAGDIMILVRSRTAFIGQLVRALKTRNIPVSGIDRMILNEELVIQDLCAVANFALLPEDDLNLASLLKSPLIGWDENKLFETAHNRNQSLWESVKNSNDKDTIKWLKTLIQRSGKQNPYEFFAQILQHPCPADSLSGLRAIKKRLGGEVLDPLDEFLNTTLDYEVDNAPSLQGFLQEHLHNKGQIKRQMEETGSAVRIMTVHGAKGLQAPIVFLPDTVRTASSNKIDRLLWPDRSGEKFPYFCPTTKDAPILCQNALDTIKSRQDEEYRRLLYVALTRAENRLYIGGYTGLKGPIDESWYRYAQKGFAKLDCEELDFKEQKILRFTNPATDKPDRSEKAESTKKIKEKAPDWLFQPMPEEPFPPRPLTPSRPSEKEVAALSPLKSGQNQRFLRGNITHKLLQILPDLPPGQRKQAASQYVLQPVHSLSHDTQESIVSETMAILEHPDFFPIFGEGSLAEVPVTGLLNDNILVSGQIDRLLIMEDEILIIDYKTNRPPPKEAKDIPDIYIKQMAAYADVMRRIYPKRAVKAALIWTDSAELMELSNL